LCCLGGVIRITKGEASGFEGVASIKKLVGSKERGRRNGDSQGFLGRKRNLKRNADEKNRETDTRVGNVDGGRKIERYVK